MKYRKVRATKMMVEHCKMIKGVAREVVSSRVYDTLDKAADAVRTSTKAVERALDSHCWGGGSYNDLLTKTYHAGGMRNGEPELHWWSIVPVVEEKE